MAISAALDFSGRTVGFAVGESTDRRLVCEAYREMSGRDSAGLLSWLQQNLDKQDLEFSMIEQWTVGTGPGSFTGLRLVTSLVLGLTYKRSVPVRGVSGAVAMVAAADIGEGTSGMVLFKGRRDDLIQVEVFRQAKSCFMIKERQLVAVDDLKQLETIKDVGSIGMLEGDFVNLPTAWQDQLAGIAVLHPHVPVGAMLFIETPDSVRRMVTDLEYIRPAVYTEPKEPRSVTEV